MRGPEHKEYKLRISSKKTVGGIAIATVIAAGAGVAFALPANATAVSASSTVVSPKPGSSAPDPTKGGHRANGITEVLLTGETAAKVKAAVLAAYPGVTIQRMENDAEGATYEAHILKTDGSPATVKLDAAFTVTGIETGGPGSQNGGPKPGTEGAVPRGSGSAPHGASGSN